MKNQKGITLILLSATVLIMIIILGTITYTSLDNFKMDQYYKMCADIELLDGKVTLYYLEHKDDEEDNYGLPIDNNQVRATSELENIVVDENNVNYNPNNSGELYKIDLSKLKNLTLNHDGDFYIDKKSHTIYYSHGYEIDGDTYYTISKKYQLSEANDIIDSLYCVVSFNSNVETEIEAQTIKKGSKVTKPDNPKKEGYEFAGWYYTPEGGEETEFDFNTEIAQDYELYAKYTGQAIMMAQNANSAFWQESIRTNLKKITFTKKASLIPENPIQTWDLRTDTTNGGQITAYLKDSENLIIYSPYTIYANPNASNYFMNFSALTTIEFNNFDTSKTTNMQQLFRNCSSLANLNVSSFNTSNVTNMWAVFYNCSNLTNLNVSNFDTSNVNIMQSIFSHCSSLKSLDLSNFNTSRVTNMAYMFENCSSLANLNISSFNTSQVTVMNGIFYGCSGLTSLDLSNFNTNQVTNMNNMFRNCTNLDPIWVGANWTTANATTTDMFAGCKAQSVTPKP